MFEVELRAGRGQPLPEWVTVIQEAQYWHVSPMEIEEWPLARVLQGQMYREAQQRAEETIRRRNP